MSTAGDEGQREVVTINALQSTIGSVVTSSDWLTIDQLMIDRFAEVTGDMAFIHTDPEKAARTRFGGTIAHGLLTLSLLPRMLQTATPLVEGLRMGVNYGFDKVRFVAPVPVRSRVRGLFRLTEIPEVKPKFFHFIYEATVEIEGLERPALSARWILGRWLD